MPPMLRVVPAMLAALLVAATAPQAVRAQDAKPAEAASAEPARDPDTVLATVGDNKVTERELQIAKDAFASELTNVPEAQQRSVLIDAVVNMELLAQAARDEKSRPRP